MATDATIIQLVVTPAIGANTVAALASAPLGMTCLVYVQPVTIEIWASRSNNRNVATKIGEVSATSGVFLHKGLGDNDTWYYWARAADHDGNVGDFYPAGVTAGVSATTKTSTPGANSVGTSQLQDGAVTNSKIGDAEITNAKIVNLAASKITAGTIAATIEILGPTIRGGEFRTNLYGQRVEIIGSSNSITTYDSSSRALLQTGGLIGGSSLSVDSYTSTTDAVIVKNNVSGSGAHALRARNAASGGGHGIVGVSSGGGGYAFFAQTGNYGPFTGAHDALILRADLAMPGDIVGDRRVLARDGIDNVLTEVAIATRVGERGVVGVISKRSAFGPEAHLSGLPFSDNDAPATFIKRHFASKFDRCTINGVGEGQVNVCGRGGNFDLGDLIVASDIPGKGQRQADDIVRSYTVARIREAVTFDHPDQVRRVACIYLCG